MEDSIIVKNKLAPVKCPLHIQVRFEELEKNSCLTKIISLRRGQIIKGTDEILLKKEDINNIGSCRYWEVINECRKSFIGIEYKSDFGIIRRVVKAEVEAERLELHKLLDDLCSIMEVKGGVGIFGKAKEIVKEWKSING